MLLFVDVAASLEDEGVGEDNEAFDEVGRQLSWIPTKHLNSGANKAMTEFWCK